jgi:FKBP-type peptidyl-prolyl cis-trans isomerase
MKLKTLLSIIVISTLLFACNKANDTTSIKVSKPKNSTDSISYAYGHTIGINIVKNLLDDSIDVNFDMIALGIKNSILEDPLSPMMSKETIDSIMMHVQMIGMEKQEKKRLERQQQFEEMEKTAAQDAKKFFEENKSKPGVIIEKSNIHYRIINEGTGNKPKNNDFIRLSLTAHILNGEEIMSTRDRGPIEYQVGVNIGIA